MKEYSSIRNTSPTCSLKNRQQQTVLHSFIPSFFHFCRRQPPLHFFILSFLHCAPTRAQDVHFSQYYNNPLLVNPANTALMPDGDWRAGAIYRKQWASVPVPYNTVSAWADFQTARNTDGSSWLGLGGAFYSDRSGNGDLALSRTQLYAAYHLGTSYTSLLSVGLNGGYNSRSVDFSKLTFDSQWDGFNFNTGLTNGENGYSGSASYWDVGAGIAYAYFPNEDLYIQGGVGVAHLNRPTESFYNGTNTIGMRPSVNVDALIRVNEGFILNPSAYYSRQKGASQLTFGTLASFNIAGSGRGSQGLTLGVHHRLGDAVIATFGYNWSSLRLTTSYDITTSQLGLYNNRAGALEISLVYEGVYGGGRPRGNFNCPRF